MDKAENKNRCKNCIFVNYPSDVCPDCKDFDCYKSPKEAKFENSLKALVDLKLSDDLIHRVLIGKNKGRVTIDFGDSPVEWLEIDKETAIDFAETIFETARSLYGHE